MVAEAGKGALEAPFLYKYLRPNAKQKMASSELIFYTYKYVWEDGTPYYIGKGQENRAFKNHGDIPVPKDRNRIIFLIENVSEKEAFQHEKEMIKFYGRKDLGTGPLLNKTSGGQGVSNRVITEELREKYREAGKVGGEITGNRCKENKTGVCGQSLEKMRENGRKSGNKNKENKTGFCGMTLEELSEAGKKGVKVTNAQKWQCTQTGYVSTSGPLTHYQNKRGIDTTKRIKVDGPRGWEITFEDGRVIVITQTLKTWAEENGYSYDCLLLVRQGRIKNHKDIIKIVSL